MEAGTTPHVKPHALSASSELAVCLRYLGGVQSRCTDLLRQQQHQIDQLQAQLIRLRAQCILERTQNLWGLWSLHARARPESLREAGAVSSKVQPLLEDKSWQTAQKIICQTGCMGHAHPWLKSDGQCARTGQECDEQDQGLARGV
jgi:hypothetical protein